VLAALQKIDGVTDITAGLGAAPKAFAGAIPSR
jgi:hypothetical protein